MSDLTQATTDAIQALIRDAQRQGRRALRDDLVKIQQKLEQLEPHSGLSDDDLARISQAVIEEFLTSKAVLDRIFTRPAEGYE